jgi:gas vesicle protein
MRERTAVLIGLVAGAIAGGVAGWLYLSDEGKRLRDQIEPQLGEFAERAGALGARAERLQRVAREGWRTVQEVAARAPDR